MQISKDLGREQWETRKREKELQRALEDAAAARELAYLKGRLEGLAAVVTGVAQERAAAAETRLRAEAAEASVSRLQVHLLPEALQGLTCPCCTCPQRVMRLRLPLTALRS